MPTASAFTPTDSERSIIAAADRGTPLTKTHHTVKHHRLAAEGIARHAFRHKNWKDGHQFTTKRKRRVAAHRSALLKREHRQRISSFVQKKRQSYNTWAENQERKADPWLAQFNTYSAGTKAVLHSLSICESGNRNLSAGFFGWLGWHAVPTLLAGTPWVVGLPSTPSAASYEQQAVVTYEVAQKYGYGGWPSCSSRLGLR